MGIQAIETRYAGCHFRSRLEARWAVFFDELGIKWEYEAQGFEVRHRITGDESCFNYLPDFWLADEDVFAEVKGSLTNDQLLRLLDVAAYLSSPNGGCGGGNDLVVLGPIPRPDRLYGGGYIPWRLHMHKGDLLASKWFGGASPCQGHLVANDGGSLFVPEHRFTEILLNGSQTEKLPSRARLGFTAARSARFEHGQSGA